MRGLLFTECFGIILTIAFVLERHFRSPAYLPKHHVVTCSTSASEEVGTSCSQVTDLACLCRISLHGTLMTPETILFCNGIRSKVGLGLFDILTGACY